MASGEGEALVSQTDLQETIQRFSDLSIAVVGDLMLDEYVWGSASRVSPESPVLVVDVNRETAVPGGAANVAANIQALGGRAAIFGVVGDDEAGQELRDSLHSRGADTKGVLVDPARPTTRKTRVVAQSQQVLRIDRELSKDLNEQVTSQLCGLVADSAPQLNAVLVSDYAKGVGNSSSFPQLIQCAKGAGKPLVVNAKPKNTKFMSGASIVTVNVSEALAASQDDRFLDDEAIHQAGADLRAAIGCEILVVTRGPKGLCAWQADQESVVVPAYPAEVYDVAGAGDTVAAVLTMSAAAGAPIEVGARIAVVAASIVVGKVGVATVSTEEILAAL